MLKLPTLWKSLLMLSAAAAAPGGLAAEPQVDLKTNAGTIRLELYPGKAPKTVENFLQYVKDGHFNGTIFHRVIPGFMIQGGGHTPNLKLKEADGGIPNESGNGLQNLRGTIAMARKDEPHTAVAQFFINIADNTSLDPRPDRWGYAVFGTVIEGMEVVDRIASSRTGPAGQFSKDVPIVPIVIKKAERFEYGT
jgi:cyclophilin family peptidyl-prolyl cis-trans isomerase